jgi:primosomal protein N' (replication factor Y)
MKLYQTYPNLPSWLSPELYVALHETLARKEQAALFLNRRGLAQTVLCPACGHHRECPNCSISLTLHGRGHLLCHYCEYHETLKDVCPDCREGELETVGLGTERVEEDLKVLFPEFRVARADRDEIQNRTAMETLIREMENHEIDILVGTQMIAKGLDFPKLKLVGLVLADIAFHLPDFRATERSFQLITQMSGRSGRHVQQGEQAGRVLIQTYNPDHPSIQFAIKHDYRGFAEFELSQREILSYPPFGRLVSIRGQSLHLNQLEKGMALLKARSLELQSKNPRYEQIEVLGPVEAPIARLRGQHRHHMLLKGQGAILRPFVSQLLDHDAWIPEHVRLLVDVDPMNLL